MPATRHRDRSMESHDAHLLGAQSLVSNKLHDADGNFVGKLEEVVIDIRTGCVRHVIVAIGGVLGIGRRRFAVPWSALKLDAGLSRAVIDMTQMRLTGVLIERDDPWLRRPASRSLASVGLAKVSRAFVGD